MYNSNQEKLKHAWSKKKIGAVLKEYRTAAGKTQLEIGRQLNKSQQSVAHWENGDAYPHLDDFFSLCTLYNINISNVFMGLDKNKKQTPNEDEELIRYYHKASLDDQDVIQRILLKYKKKYLEEFSKELAT